MAKTDYRTGGTLLGAVLGLLAVRGLLPEKNRTGGAYATGAGIGGTAGYVGGSYANQYAPEIKRTVDRLVEPTKPTVSGAVQKDLNDIRSQVESGTTGKMPSDLWESIQGLLGQEGYDTGIDVDGEGTVHDIDPAMSYSPGRGKTGDQNAYDKAKNIFHNRLQARSAAAIGNTDKMLSAEDEVDRLKSTPTGDGNFFVPWLREKMK